MNFRVDGLRILQPGLRICAARTAGRENPEGRLRGKRPPRPGTDAGRETHCIMKPTDTPARVGPK